jgi:hypothetical protein
MGGLIVRCMVQRIIPNDPDAGGHLGSGADFVERISPNATPHGGIEFAVGGGLLETLRDLIEGPGRRHLRYGMVNSEEGYQNLRRFLFGDLRVQVELVGLDVQGREDDYHLATGDVPGDPRSARSRARVLHRPSRTKRGLAKYPSQLRFRSPWYVTRFLQSSEPLRRRFYGMSRLPVKQRGDRRRPVADCEQQVAGAVEG